MNKFTLGVFSGISSLALAVPILAQVSSAATGDGVPSDAMTMPTPTQACAAAMADLEDAHLMHFDEMMTKQKLALQTRRDALTAAALITDDAQRQEALKAMHDQMKDMKPDAEDKPADITAAIEAVRAACGDTFGPGMRGMGMMGGFGGHHGKGPGFHKGDLAEKLGMTEVELKTALDAGKKIEDIAAEKGITLPARPMRGQQSVSEATSQ